MIAVTWTVTISIVAVLALGQQSVMFSPTELDGGFIKYSSSYSFEAALSLLSDQISEVAKSFRSELTAIIGADHEGFDAVFWECPPCTSTTLALQKFEFVILPTNELTKPSVQLSDVAFLDRLKSAKQGSLAVEFANIGGDSVLVSPIPERQQSSHYTHLKAFLRSATTENIDAWLAATAAAYTRTIQGSAGQKVWLSTHGGGVGYLHARIDRRPKYYHYRDYKNA